jgi:PDZ domain-containing protein
MTQHPIPRYFSKPKFFLLLAILFFALIAPMPFAIISPGPVTNLLSNGIKFKNDIDRGKFQKPTGRLYSLSVYITNPDRRPPGIMVLEAWLKGSSVVLPNEIVYKEGETTKSANAQGKKDMIKSETTAAIAAANFLRSAQPDKPLDWKISDIKFVMKKVGGPSAGLAFSLALIAKLSHPELISNRNIAVTGTISETGKVGSIGGIDQKLIAAKSAGATIAVIPKSNCEDITVTTNGLQVIAVASLSEAFHGLIDPLAAKSMNCPL